MTVRFIIVKIGNPMDWMMEYYDFPEVKKIIRGRVSCRPAGCGSE